MKTHNFLQSRSFYIMLALCLLVWAGIVGAIWRMDAYHACMEVYDDADRCS
ncbi:hypothetical protein [Nostoc linckia]|uniref:hypothetical protein n=1 Tax=Nostoc linckia TaxID=92942 RepID=UPI0015D50853|nr:hypothetical protein [Nostoc linckia]